MQFQSGLAGISYFPLRHRVVIILNQLVRSIGIHGSNQITRLALICFIEASLVGRQALLVRLEA
jgi:hypothetical protein